MSDYEFTQNEDGTWFARVVGKPGCMTDSWPTMKEAAKQIQDAERLWDEAVAEDSQ